MKYFILPNIFDSPEILKTSKPSLLFVISLVAHYSEKQRLGGFSLDKNILFGREYAEYRIRISQKEIQKMFGFSLDSIIRIKQDLSEKIVIEPAKILSISKDYYKNENIKKGPIEITPYDYTMSDEEYLFLYQDRLEDHQTGRSISLEEGLKATPKRFLKYLDIEDEYGFGIRIVNRSLLQVPVGAVYNKRMSISEKLAIVWNIGIKDILGRQAKLEELEKLSGISERTFRNAKKYYPGFFRKQQESP
jgi:hypothetical protein